MAIASINPANGKLLKSFEPLSDAQIEEKIVLACKTFKEYKKVPFSERATMMLRAADIVEKEKQTFGRLMTLELLR
jgi:succinate-semialdehyde dehydrogenase/glutarate-semialdehyde dehydrogenase